MHNGKSSRASLRIFSQTHTAAQLTALLEQAPSSFYSISDPVSKRGKSSNVREYNMWLLSSTAPTTENLEVHIEELVAFVESKSQVIGELRASCEIDIFCGFSSKNGQGGFVLPPELLARLSNIRLHLILDLYPPTEELLRLDDNHRN